MTKSWGIRIALIIILFVVGLFILIRSCLAKYDERSAVGGSGSSTASQFLVFEKDGKGVIFSLVKFEKAISYKQNGGSVLKNVTSTYYAQANDLSTAAKIGTQKIKGSGQVKAYPIELLGAADNKAWLFAGELIAYDPFTLTKLADAAILEEKNPALKGKLINERRYYTFDNTTGQIKITAADGAIYTLNTNTFIATPAEEESSPADVMKKRAKELMSLIKKLEEQKTAAYSRLRESNEQYREKKLSAARYKDSSTLIEQEARNLTSKIDSLYDITRDIANEQNTATNNQNRKESARRMGGDYRSMLVNSDTLNGRWYGLFTTEGLNKLRDRFDYITQYDDAARNKLFTASLTPKNNDWLIDEERTKAGDAVYLQGGFFLDKETGIPFHVQGDFLIVYKDRIGNEGMVQLARIKTTGEVVWTISTGLKEFNDWQLRGSKLVITGRDNKNLSSGQVNVLQVISLQNGTIAAYDFFADKTKPVK